MMRMAMVLAAALPLAAAFPLYDIPSLFAKLFQEDDSDTCTLPEGFMVEQFQIWTPDSNNTSHGTEINFAYWDNSTDLQTVCRLNSSSVNVATGGYGVAARYACDNANVEFIWQNSALTMIEKACPTSSQ
jgi:hypothetical protein